ncbi:uncharacterized protein LOC124646510 isoform X2 [Lolium rigidum]|uniref:uncharacterized protein LOC124646510 isoform X2 n=1 Tax=Lolium rigidum TaxID=89674 RepID=UPI001F5C163D|nr:uncharacterized protein LOC124646510 isoform X2 [Lolium rigidum]
MSPWTVFKGEEADPDSYLQSDDPAGDSEFGNESYADHDAFLDLHREILDPCFAGTDLKTHQRCRHGEAPQRKVAFNMAATGRRFLGCLRQVFIMPRSSGEIMVLF